MRRAPTIEGRLRHAPAPRGGARKWRFLRPFRPGRRRSAGRDRASRPSPAQPDPVARIVPGHPSCVSIVELYSAPRKQPCILNSPKKSWRSARMSGAFSASACRTEIRDKVLGGRELARDDYLLWQRRLYERGWGAMGWPVQFGGAGWNAVQQYIFEEESAHAGAPRLIPFGLKMVAPVIMAFGTPAQQQSSFLPQDHPRRSLVVPGIFRAGRGIGPGLAAHARDTRGRSLRRQRPEDLEYARPFCRLDFLPGAHRPAGKAAVRHHVSADRHEKSRASACARSRCWTAAARSTTCGSRMCACRVENRVGEENRGWTYAKFLLGHERTNYRRHRHRQARARALKRTAAEERAGWPAAAR